MQELILGKKSDLSQDELENFLSCPNSPEKILTLAKALNHEYIDPELVLTFSIRNAKNKEDLIPIALALRYGANPNLYICKIHILAYSYQSLGVSKFTSCIEGSECNKLLNSVIMLLRSSGSNPFLPVYLQEETEETLFRKCSKDVMTWLCENGYDTILTNLDLSLSNVKAESATMIGVLLDDKSILKSDPKLDDLILSHSYKILGDYLDSFNSLTGLQTSIKYLNLTAFEAFIETGINLDYLAVTKLLIRMKEYKKEKDLISLSQLFNMLLYAVTRGCSIDEYQFNYLSEIEPTFAATLNKEYQKPFWQKNCLVSKGKVRKELKLLAYQLGLDPMMEKCRICYNLARISETKLEEAVEAIRRRQEQRISYSLINYLELTGQEIPHVLLRNSSMLKEVYGYPDNDISFYKDINGASWIFTRNLFQELLEERINPYTQLPLPQLLMDEMEKRNQYFTEIFKENIKPKLISEVLTTLNDPDTISDSTTEKTITSFLNLGLKNGLTEDQLKSLSNDTMTNLLNDLTGEFIELSNLSKEFAFATFSVTAQNHLFDNPLQAMDFFSMIKLNNISIDSLLKP